MDRIENFLNKRVQKNKRRVTYKGKKYEITKEEVKKVRLVRNNYCISSLNMYEPLSTKFSGEKLENGIFLETKNSKNKLCRFKKMEYYLRERYEEEEEIKDIWEEDSYQVSIDDINLNVFNKEQYDNVDDLKLDKENLEVILETLHRKYFVPFKKIIPISQLIPKKEKVNADFTSEILKIYNFDHELDSCYFDNTFSFSCVVKEFTMYIYYLRNLSLIFTKRFETKIRKILILRNGIICILLTNEIILINNMSNIKFQNIENENILKININESILDFYFDENQNKIFLIGKKNLFGFDMQNYAIERILTVKGHRLVSINMIKDYLLIISSTIDIKIVDVSNKKNTGTLVSSFPHAIFIKILNSKYIFCANNNFEIHVFEIENVKNNKTIKFDSSIYDLAVNSFLNLFCVCFENEMVIFEIKMEKTFIITPIKKFKGEYRNCSFYEECSLIYCRYEDKIIVLG
ncbi:hypothetical protein LUQ84_002319 [Hamiltosporidium tvaerminnensis]|nr:hypothetical protein LUQ84_002319 [Hamiltosporidium tvaerminnensis]